MLEAKLKQVQEEVAAGRLLPAAGAAASAAGAGAATPTGMVTPQPATAPASEEGVYDRMRRFMQQIPGASPGRDGTPMATPLGESPCAARCLLHHLQA